LSWSLQHGRDYRLVKSTTAVGKLFHTFAIRCDKNCFWELMS